MILNTFNFKPLFLSSVIASVLSSSFSFDVRAGAYDDGYSVGKTEGYNQGIATCAGKIYPSECPSVQIDSKDKCPTTYDTGYKQGQSDKTCPTQKDTPVDCPNTYQQGKNDKICITNDRYQEGYNQGLADFRNWNVSARSGLAATFTNTANKDLHRGNACGTNTDCITFFDNGMSDYNAGVASVSTGSTNACSTGETVIPSTGGIATFNNGMLTLPMVSVGTTTYSNIGLKHHSSFAAPQLVFSLYTMDSNPYPVPLKTPTLRIITTGTTLSELAEDIKVTMVDATTNHTKLFDNASLTSVFTGDTGLISSGGIGVEGLSTLTLNLTGAKWFGDCVESTGGTTCTVNLSKPFPVVVLVK